MVISEVLVCKKVNFWNAKIYKKIKYISLKQVVLWKINHYLLGRLLSLTDLSPLNLKSSSTKFSLHLTKNIKLLFLIKCKINSIETLIIKTFKAPNTESETRKEKVVSNQTANHISFIAWIIKITDLLIIGTKTCDKKYLVTQFSILRDPRSLYLAL